LKQASVTSERRQAEADLGPVRYLVTLIGSTDEATMRWFILAVALLLDPAAVLLLFAAARWPSASRPPSVWPISRSSRPTSMHRAPV
jgi:hypothetical protein